MSYLSVALKRLSETCQVPQSEIARVSGASKSFVSRLVNGESRDLSDDYFCGILRSFANHPQAQAQIIAARCMDARKGPGADLVEIIVKAPTDDRPPPSLPDVPLPAETERAFAWLRAQCPLNPDLEKHLVGYAKLTGMK